MNWDAMAEEYLGVAQLIFGELRETIDGVSDDLARRIQAGGTVFICGNGGSAADAQHMAAELVNRFLKERRPYASVALTTDSSVLTSIGNDYGFDQVFSKQIEALAKPGDALIAISTSGNAANVLRAVEAARQKQVHVIAMTGGAGGALADACDTLLSISCTRSVPRIQEGHGLIIHALCERMEERLM
jgi:D-sedoheptulose 7-phosphate isomerase